MHKFCACFLNISIFEHLVRTKMLMFALLRLSFSALTESLPSPACWTCLDLFIYCVCLTCLDLFLFLYFVHLTCLYLFLYCVCCLTNKFCNPGNYRRYLLPTRLGNTHYTIGYNNSLLFRL